MVDLQTPFDAAVVVPTVLRPELERAVTSVYEQLFAGRIQVLVGVDRPDGDRAVLEALERARPDYCALTVVDLGYSTARLNGGLYTATDGGVLRAILSLAANSRHVTYLDDDNWWEPDHLASLRDAIGDRAWAYSLRVLVDEETLEPVCVDRWHSVGPDRGTFKEELGGFCDPNTLMIDKLRCHDGLTLWCQAAKGVRTDADRRFFGYLSTTFDGTGTGRATVNYLIRRTHVLWTEIRAGTSQEGFY